MIVADHTISGPSGMDVRRYGRLLARFTPKVIQTEAENEEARAVVESMLERSKKNPPPLRYENKILVARP